jgi:hypothetical protein
VYHLTTSLLLLPLFYNNVNEFLFVTRHVIDIAQDEWWEISSLKNWIYMRRSLNKSKCLKWEEDEKRENRKQTENLSSFVNKRSLDLVEWMCNLSNCNILFNSKKIWNWLPLQWFLHFYIHIDRVYLSITRPFSSHHKTPKLREEKKNNNRKK